MICTWKEALLRVASEGTGLKLMCTYQEYVVPRSIPITVPTSFLSAFSSFLSSPLTRSKLLAKARAQNVQIDFIMKICPIISYKIPVTISTNKKTTAKFLMRSSWAGWYFARYHACSSLIGQTSPRWPILIGPRCTISSFSLGFSRMSCQL